MIGAGLTGAAVGNALGNTLERFTAGAVEEVAGFRGREGGRAGSVQVTSALTGGLAGGAAAGAAIGAGVGGPFAPITAAIGVALGAVIGAAGGLIVGSINGPLEDAAFAAAKKLQKSGEGLASTLSDLDKDFSVSNFDQFTSGLIQFQADTEEAAQTFKEKFASEATFKNLFRTDRGDTRRALQSLSELVDPKEVAKARDNLNQGIATVSRAIDLDVTGIENYNDFLSNLTDAADKGNALAKNYVQALSEQYDLELTSRAIELEKLGTGRSVGGFQGTALGPALRQLQEAANLAGKDLFNMSKEELKEFARGTNEAGVANINGSRAFKESVANIVSAQNDEIKKRQEEAAALAKTNELLRQAEQALNLFVNGLNKIEDELAVSIAQTSLSVSNLEATTNALSNSQILFTDSLNGFDFGEAGGELRQERISAIGRATGQDVSTIQKFDTVVTNADEIGKGALSVLNEQAQDGQVNTRDVQRAFISEIEGSLGASLSGPLKEGVEKSFAAFASRQSGDGSQLSIDALKDAVEQGKVKELFGPTFEKFSQTTQKLSDAFDALNQITVEQANVKLSLMTAERKAEAETLKRQRAIEDFQIDPEKVFGGDGIAKAESRVAEDLDALGFSATTSAQDIAEAQRNAIDEQKRLDKALQERTITETEFVDQSAQAADANARASAALDILANDTRKLSAIQAEAQKLIQRRAEARELGGQIVGANLTGDIGTQVRFEESRRIAQGAIGPGATQQAQQQAFLRARQDPEFKRIFAVQARSQGEEGTTDEIFDRVQAQNLRAQAAQARAGGDNDRAAFLEQLATDIEADDLEDIQRKSLDVQREQLEAQRIIAAQQQLLLQAQFAALGEQSKVFKKEFDRLTNALNNLGTTQGEQAATQQQQAATQQKQADAQQQQAATQKNQADTQNQQSTTQQSAAVQQSTDAGELTQDEAERKKAFFERQKKAREEARKNETKVEALQRQLDEAKRKDNQNAVNFFEEQIRQEEMSASGQGSNIKGADVRAQGEARRAQDKANERAARRGRRLGAVSDSDVDLMARAEQGQAVQDNFLQASSKNSFLLRGLGFSSSRIQGPTGVSSGQITRSPDPLANIPDKDTFQANIDRKLQQQQERERSAAEAERNRPTGADMFGRTESVEKLRQQTESRNRETLENTYKAFESLFMSFGEKMEENAQTMLNAADIQNAAGEKQQIAAETQPTDVNHIMNTLEVNGVGDLANGFMRIANTLGEVTQNLIDPKNTYKAEQGDGTKLS